jgi:hypothetical protein
MAPEPYGSIRHKDGIKLAMAYKVLDNSKAKLENSLIEPVMEGLGVHLVTIGVRSTGEFARGLGHLTPCIELSIARLEERIPEMTLLDDAVPIAGQLLPSVDIFPTRLLVL